MAFEWSTVARPLIGGRPDPPESSSIPTVSGNSKLPTSDN